MKHKSIILQFIFFYLIITSCYHKKEINMLQGEKSTVKYSNQEIKNIHKPTFQSFYIDLDQKPKRMLKLRYKDLSIAKELKCIIESIKTNLNSLISNHLMNTIAQFCFGHSFKGLETKLENSKEIIVIEPNDITNKRIFDVNYVSKMGFFCYLDKSYFSVPKLFEKNCIDSNRPRLNIESFQKGIKSLNLESLIKQYKYTVENAEPFIESDLINLTLINNNNLLILYIEKEDIYYPICFINNKKSNDLILKFENICVIYPKYKNQNKSISIEPCFGECLLLIPSILDLKFEEEELFNGDKAKRPTNYAYDDDYRKLDEEFKKITFIKLKYRHNFQKPIKKYFDDQTIYKRCSLKFCDWLGDLYLYCIHYGIHYIKPIIVILLSPILISFLYKWIY